MSRHEERIALATDFFNISEVSFTTGSPWTIEQFLAFFENPHHHYFLIREQNQVVGFLLISIVFEIAEIQLIGVDKQLLRKGLGSQLIAEAIDYLITEEVSNLLLEVRESNIRAKDFYESQGFEIIGIRKNYYHNPVENAILLQLKL